MECQNTIKTLKINKNKSIGTVVIVVEGENDEFRLLKHIFTKIFDYNYITLKRNKVMQYEFKSKKNKNDTIIIANTKNSNIKSLTDDKKYKEELYRILQSESKSNLKNTNIYILWDRDKESENDYLTQVYYRNAINTFSSSMDNDYEMNGLLLISYPCYESYNLSNFHKRYWKKTYKKSVECKKEFNTSKYTIKDINDRTILLAVENMHKSMLEYGIISYNTDNFKNINEKIYKKEEECFKNNKYLNALSLISIILIDLGIITENE